MLCREKHRFSVAAINIGLVQRHDDFCKERNAYG